jgi:hypothetical protein
MAIKTQPKTVQYHSPFAPAKTFLVLKENKDGTVDIGREDGVVVVSGCKITDAPTIGHVTAYTPDESVAKMPVDLKISALLKSKSRDELLNRVKEVNFHAKNEDEKISVSPTVSTTELIEKLTSALTPKE